MPSLARSTQNGTFLCAPCGCASRLVRGMPPLSSSCLSVLLSEESPRRRLHSYLPWSPVRGSLCANAILLAIICFLVARPTPCPTCTCASVQHSQARLVVHRTRRLEGLNDAFLRRECQGRWDPIFSQKCMSAASQASLEGCGSHLACSMTAPTRSWYSNALNQSNLPLLKRIPGSKDADTLTPVLPKPVGSKTGLSALLPWPARHNLSAIPWDALWHASIFGPGRICNSRWPGSSRHAATASDHWYCSHFKPEHLRIGKPVFARVTLLHASFSGTMCVLYWMWVVRSAHSQVPSTRCMATASSQRHQTFYTHSMARVAHPSMSSFGPAAYLMLSLTCTPSFHLETAPLTSFTPARLSTWATRTPRSLKFSVSFARAGTSFSGVQDTEVSLELRSLLRIWDGRRCTKCTTRMQSAAACIPSRIKCR